MIGVIGLGLIGGSMAKALNQNTDHTVYGFDKDETVCHKAKLVNAIEEAMTLDILKECNIVIIALYPNATLDYIRENRKNFKKGAIVLDCSGVKQVICNEAYEIAKEEGFIFMGGHPMAGLEHSGFEYAKRALFKEASMVLTPAPGTEIEEVEKIKGLCQSIGFTNIEITTPKRHDEIIAFTSQLPHIVSSSYIKSKEATEHQGFSAGSYRDLSRVAKLNAEMWTELFMDNKEFLAEEIDGIIERLEEYSIAIKNGDEKELKTLLQAGTDRKILIDKESF